MECLHELQSRLALHEIGEKRIRLLSLGAFLHFTPLPRTLSLARPTKCFTSSKFVWSNLFETCSLFPLQWYTITGLSVSSSGLCYMLVNLLSSPSHFFGNTGPLPFALQPANRSVRTRLPYSLPLSVDSDHSFPVVVSTCSLYRLWRTVGDFSSGKRHGVARHVAHRSLNVPRERFGRLLPAFALLFPNAQKLRSPLGGAPVYSLPV